MSVRKQVFCYGEIGVDNIIRLPDLPTPELAVFPTSDSYHIGGAAANTAVWLAHLGVPVGLAGNAIGNDLYGQQLWDWLGQHEPLDLSLVERLEDGMTPFCRVMVTPDGERSFLIFWYPQSPKTGLPSKVPTPFRPGTDGGHRTWVKQPNTIWKKHNKS